MAPLGQKAPEGLDEGRLADPGHTGQSDPQRPAGVGRQIGEERVGIGAVLGPRGLHQRDRPPDRPPVARTHTGGETGDVGHGDSSWSSNSAAASVRTVPGPKIAATPIAFSAA